MFITRIEDRNGNVLQTFMPERKEVISDVTAYSVTSMMEGVVKFGTGRRMWSYGISGAIAGKTGTTNDNTDSWFMGFTPQLMGGVWAGCDDRFVRFNSDIGQGSSVALPVWAYFYDKVSKDKNLAIDTRSQFVKPESLTNEIIYDWNNTTPLELGAEGEDMGNGSEQDYGDFKPEDIKPESVIPVQTDTSKNKKPPVKPKKDSLKAIMPPKIDFRK